MMDAAALALAGLSASAFLSATLLPGNSELALTAYLYKWPDWLWPALLAATLANTAGSISSLWLGRLAPQKALTLRLARWFERFGPATLLLAWVPLIGDALPLAAGWLRLPLLPSVLWLTVGKGLRYGAIALTLQVLAR